MELDIKHPVAGLLKARSVTVRALATKLGVTTQAIHYHLTAGDGVKIRTLVDLAKACGAKIYIGLEKKSVKEKTKP